MQGTSWADSMFKHIFRVDRIRRVSPVAFEIDLSLYIAALASIMLSTSESDWSVYALNDEGVEVVTQFAFEQDGAQRLPLLPAADEEIESLVDNKIDTPIVVTSMKDTEKSAAKKLILNSVRVVSSGNPVLMQIVQQGCQQGTITMKSAPANVVNRIVVASKLETNTCLASKGGPLWVTLLGQHNDTSFAASKGEGVSLSDFGDGRIAPMDSAGGIASLWDSYIKVVVKLAGETPSARYHLLQVTSLPFIAALRDESTDSGALGNLPIDFLKDMNNKKFVKLGILIEDHSMQDDSEESKNIFVEALQSLFAIDDEAVESLVQKFNRFAGKRKREEAAAAKLVRDAVKKTGQVGGGSGRGASGGRGSGSFARGGAGGGRSGSFIRTANTGRGGSGGGSVGGNGSGLQGVVTKAICVAQLQHRVQGSVKCGYDDDKCSFSHAPLHLLDRDKAISAAQKVVTNPGRLAAFIAKLSDVSLKFLGD